MPTNTLTIAPSDINRTFPLKGDMNVSLNFIPDGDFSVTFVTYSSNDFTLNSTTSMFRQLSGMIGKSLKVGGNIALFFTLMYNRKTNTWDIGANNLASVGGGGSGGRSEEVLLVQDANGIVTPDAKLGNNFRIITKANIRFENPVGYDSSAEIYITIVQGPGAPHVASFGTAYAMQDAQPAQLAVTEKAINLMRLHSTIDEDLGQLWITETTPDKSYQVGFAPVTVLAMIGSKEYFQMGVPGGSTLPGAMFELKDGEVLKVIRNGRGPECSGTVPVSSATDLSKTFTVIGMPYGSGTDKRPTLTMMPENRPSYNKAILNFEGKGHAIVKDIKVGGVRNNYNDARGICHNADAMSLTLHNVEIFDTNNGIMTGNRGMIGNTYMYDVVIDRCGVGGPTPDPGHGYTTVGYTHSVYFGHNDTRIEMTRCSLINAVHGDNLKSRSGSLFIKQVLCKGARNGRELEIPNGGWVEAEDCIFWKSHTDAGTGNLAIVGGNGGPPNTTEGLNTTRPRKYKFTNCRFQIDIPAQGRDVQFIVNLDPDVPLEFIDCEFVGESGLNNNNTPIGEGLYNGTVTVKGIRYKPSAPPIFTYTGGPLGPRLPVGYFPIPMENES